MKSPRLSILGPLLGFAFPLLAQTPPVPAPYEPANGPPAWAVASSPARITIEVDKDSKPTPLSWATLCLPDPRWASIPLRIFNEDGIPVASQLLWKAPGEPVTLLFDSSSNTRRYDVYPAADWPPLSLTNLNQGVLLECRAGDGKTIDHLPDMLDAWNKSPTIIGRAIVPGIFEGGNRFGPEGNLLEHLQGWFNVTAPEHLEFVTMSNDASFVLLDGKEVVEWPGRHPIGEGETGKFHGEADLMPGIHSIEYYNAFVSMNEGRSLQFGLAVKGGSLTDWKMLTPDNTFFTPTVQAHLTDYSLPNGRPDGASTNGNVPPYMINWQVAAQSDIGPMVSDIGLISMHLVCCGMDNGTATWTFDDGTTQVGQNIVHLFPRPGLRAIRVSVKDGDTDLGSATQTIFVHPDWIQLTSSPPDLAPAALTEIMSRDPNTFSATDLAGTFAVLEVYKSSDGLRKFLPAVCAKMKDIPDADLPYIKDAAVLLAPDLAHATDATQLLQALIDRCSAAKAPSPLVALASEARLALAQLTLLNTDHLDQVRVLLDAINVPSLTGDEHRDFGVLQADLALSSGDVAGAKKQYLALTGDPSGPDARSSIRQTAEVGQARTFLDQKDYESAEDALSGVVQQAPAEKLASDWALIRLRLYRAENLPMPAYLWAKRLIPVLVEDGRPELLFTLTDLAYQQGDNELANKALAELLKKYPYSSEAAQAKEKWPGK